MKTTIMIMIMLMMMIMIVLLMMMMVMMMMINKRYNLYSTEIQMFQGALKTLIKVTIKIITIDKLKTHQKQNVY